MNTPAAGAPALVLFILCLGALQIWTFHWGVITPDTVEQYGQALSGQYEDWHPPVTAWIWRMLLNIHQGSAPFLVMNALLYWLGFGLIAEAFRRRGQMPGVLATLAIGLLPIPFGQIGSILKDSLMGACLIAVAGVAGFHHLLDRGMPWFARGGSLLLLVIAAATRFNGVFAVAPLALYFLSPAIWQRSWRAIVPGIVAVALLFAASSYLINVVLLRPLATQPLISLINFDLAGMSRWSGRNLYPMPRPPSPQLVRQCYTPAIFSPHDQPRCNAVAGDLAAWLKESGHRPVKVWLEAMARAPLAYLWHRASHFNVNQRWFLSTVPDDAIYVMTTPNDLGLSFETSRAAKFVYHLASAMAWSPLGRPATWLALAAAVLMLGRAMRQHPLARTFAASVLCYSGAYAVVSVAPDMRYNSWPITAMPLAILLIWGSGRGIDAPRRSFALAQLLFAAALGGELLAVMIG